MVYIKMLFINQGQWSDQSPKMASTHVMFQEYPRFAIRPSYVANNDLLIITIIIGLEAAVAQV